MAYHDVMIPFVVGTIDRTKLDHVDALESIIKDKHAVALVVGLPRDQRGGETDQTARTRDYVADLKGRIKLPIHFQDESLTSVIAEKELVARAKPYEKSDIDALAAAMILKDHLEGHMRKGHQ